MRLVGLKLDPELDPVGAGRSQQMSSSSLIDFNEAMAYDPTPEQRLILDHEPDRHGRVLAGPGTGKSATVVISCDGCSLEIQHPAFVC